MRALRALSERDRSIIVGLLAFALAAVWSVASPLSSGPDELAHAAKAASTVRGVLVGEQSPGRSPGFRDVVIPGVLVGPDPTCFVLKLDATADCLAFDLPAEDVRSSTSAGTYPPVYYALVGLPTLVFSGISGVRLERLLGAALFGIFVGLAWRVARSCGRPGAVRAGIAVAVTPMALFSAAVINPSGLEIAAALAFWVALVARVSGGGRVVAVSVAVAGSALACARPASPLWTVLIVGLVAVWAGVTRRAELSSTIRILWQPLVPVAVVCLAQSVWVKVVGVDDLPQESAVRASDAVEAFRSAIGQTGTYLLHSVGTVGWLDLFPPFVSVAVWSLSAGGLLAFVVAGARGRHLVAIGLLAILWWVMPAVFEADQATQSGFRWQGRYGLPLLIGIPVLCGASLTFRPALVVAHRCRVVVGIGLWAGHVSLFYWALHRYMVGVSGPLWPFGSPAWNPPGGGLVNLVVFAVVTAAFLAAVLGLPAEVSHGTGEEPPHGTEHALESSARRP
ncbi:MAG: DUF2142 domain-containing protein [Acidimicrobiales bacterium]